MLSHPDFKEKNIIIVFTNEGQYFSFKNDNLVVKDKEDKVVLQSTCHQLLALWVVGHCSLSSGLMERSKKFGFPIVLFSFNFRMIGAWNAPTEGNYLLRKKQYAYQDWTIAKHLMHNKIENQIETLNSIRKKTPACKDAIQSLRSYQSQLPQTKELSDIMGLEGVASRLYFEQWFFTLPWKGRKPRAKIDPINVLLDIGYTFLFYMVENMLHLYGFDIYEGVYHRNFYNRKSLVCDLQEPFRCIVDKQVKRAYGLGQIKAEDFIFEKGQYKLTPLKSKEYTRWLMQGILEYKSDIFLYCQKYYRCFIREKPIAEYPFFTISSPQNS
ncbi:MAG: type V CRISPR-associated endonuclease Cas1 [Bacteroidetes bacterium]|nr:type V CRISPR-associated endonuclease Cas1 [Bacteroidota bacterium]MBS1740359.1 type V CRISPR-associated endonuclease Cas1 [Bacteroidota bacterium]